MTSPTSLPDLGTAPDAGGGTWKPSNETRRRVWPASTPPERPGGGAQPGRHDGPFTGGVPGSAETEPALEFSEVGT